MLVLDEFYHKIEKDLHILVDIIYFDESFYIGGGSSYIGGGVSYRGIWATTIGGNSLMPNPLNGTNIDGHSGHGFARISFLSLPSSKNHSCPNVRYISYPRFILMSVAKYHDYSLL